jgi:hypothetical protein
MSKQVQSMLVHELLVRGHGLLRLTLVDVLLRYLTMWYITGPIMVRSMGTTSHPPSLDTTLRGSSRASMSCSRSTDLWHIGHFATHAARRSKANRYIVYTGVSLKARTLAMRFSLCILEQGDCLGCDKAYTWQLVSKCC